MNEPITIIISTSIITTSIIVFIGFLIKNWMIRKIQYAVKLNYDKQLEEFKEENLKRTKAILVADLISEWLSFPKEQKTLNKLTFEAFLWLPKPIASNLSNLLAHKENAPEVREVLHDVRKYLLQKEDELRTDEIIVFTQEHKEKLVSKKMQ